MHLETFAMERYQSTWENIVDYNLSESGVHPFALNELLSAEQLAELSRIRLGYNQTNGTEALRETIASLYPGANSSNILVTSGSAEANFLAIWYLLDSGDEMALMLPNYMQIWGAARAFGAQVRPFHLIPVGDIWQLDSQELKQAVTPKTRLVAVCHPNNPTGAQLSAAEMEMICQTAARVNAWILSDEVYRGAERIGDLTPTFWGQTDKVIITGGLSKAYGLAGLRIGWVVAPSEIIDHLWGYHDYTTICVNPLSDHLARLALSSPMRSQIWQRSREIIGCNYAILQDWLQRFPGLFEWIPPAAGAIALVKYHAKLKSLDLVTQLRQQKSVLIVPGIHFLMENYLRFGFGSPANYLTSALQRCTEFFSGLSGRA
ncbi:MAG: aminotransferase class I/II-fold pyridoxal phosphate-dependent enzyme [candidate division KSB1 bacterium]|nr:aminotransferase class I/II-fold pyridoxal phosphate-dependent enzyme [candidate division KSB1 bacterium]